MYFPHYLLEYSNLKYYFINYLVPHSITLLHSYLANYLSQGDPALLAADSQVTPQQAGGQSLDRSGIIYKYLLLMKFLKIYLEKAGS